MNKVLIQFYEFSVFVKETVVRSFDDLAFIEPQVTVKRVEEKSKTRIRIARIGECVDLELRTEFGFVRTRALVAASRDNFLLIDIPPVGAVGNIYSIKDSAFLGIVVPISIKSEFVVGISIGFFLDRPVYPELEYNFPVTKVHSSMAGSGVVLGERIMITNAHVILNSDNCKLNFGRNQGKLLKKGLVLDLALFETDLDSNKINFSRKIFEGQKVLTCGFAVVEGVFPIVTSGFLTKIVYYRGFPLLGMISAKTFNGQSGGGVFNENFELIGIITANAKSNTDGIYSDLGFCILHPSFSLILQGFNHMSLLDDDSEELQELCSFQTTKMLPSPKI